MEPKETWSLVPHSGLRPKLRQGDLLAQRYVVSGRLEARTGCDAYVVQALDDRKHYTLLIPRREQEGGYSPERLETLIGNARLLLVHREESLCLRDVVEVESRWGLVTDQWVRKSLAQLIEESGALEERRVLLIMIDAARALALAHKSGVYHQGFGPDSIFLRPGDGHLALCNFGLLAPHESDDDDELTLTDGNSESYLNAYRSPEVIAGLETSGSPPSDVWAFGLCLYFALTGRLPFNEKSLSGITSAVQSLHSRQLSDLQASPELRAVIIRCLQQDSSQRYSTIDAVLASLLAIHRGLETLPDAAPSSCTARLLRWSKQALRLKN